MNIGNLTWSLLYVALSRTRKLSHMKLFPTGSTDFYHPMYFAHLLRLRMPSKLKKWYRSYDNHCWNKRILQEEHLEQVEKVERELTNIGRKKLMGLGWNKLFTLVKELGYKATTRDRKKGLYCILCEHLVKRLLWKDPVRNHKPSRKRKRIETQDSIVDISSKPGSRLSKRFKRNQPSSVKQQRKKRGISKLVATSISKNMILYDEQRRSGQQRSIQFLKEPF